MASFTMEDYQKAYKLGKKDYQARMMRGELPTLQVLDDILPPKGSYSEVPLGLVQIPIDQIVGTKSDGRSNAFAGNFMPILRENTEFAYKWATLSQSHIDKGIREPIKAYEYMNKFYVQEGNKRVSVLKYFDAVSVPGYVTRILPPRTDQKENKLYYEFVDFYAVTQINYIWFTKPGSFVRLQAAFGKGPKDVWTDDDRLLFSSVYSRFSIEYEALGGKKLSITTGDAFLAFLTIYNYEVIDQKTTNEMKELVANGTAHNIKNAKKMVEKLEPAVWDILEEVIREHPVMLNRAPTLHRLGIQAFEPVLVEGRALKLHPLVCTAYNADFDGDQMAVHVPLSAEAQAEARFLMLAAGNLLKPSDGRPVAVPSQDMILGSYYLTLDKNGEPGEGKIFRNEDEALMAYDAKYITLHSKIKVRRTQEINGEMKTGLVDTTVGRIIFNRPIPQDLGFVDRSIPENELKYEIDFLVGKSQLGKIIDKCIRVHGTQVTSQVLDSIKSQGYKYSTIGAITVAVCDAAIPPAKKEIIAKAEVDKDEITELYNEGLMSNEERYKNVLKIWNKATDDVTEALKNNMDAYNPIWMMADSGARGSMSQIRQLAGMRGLIANTSGKTIEIPIRANYREGLNILEYFISSRGARKGLADTALRTADSGYLTRRLVDVSQDVIVREDDCGTHDGIDIYTIYDGKRKIEDIRERLLGRYLAEDFIDPQTGEVLVSKETMMGDKEADIISNSGVEKIKIRSILGCRAKHGVCRKCYGSNLANGMPVTVGEAVGTIAAQSIGEPGTQLTMRTFHTGGVAGGEDITQGLPRVEELFESRRPKHQAILSEIDGEVRFETIKGARHAVIFNKETADERSYLIPHGSREKIQEGQFVSKGDMLTEGAKNPHDVLDILGVEAVQNYLIEEVQRTYRLQGVAINDKHIEVIVRQMMRKVKIDEPGSTNLMTGAQIDKNDFITANEEIQSRIDAGETDLELATATQQLLGITKASLATDSFLSAASFQETTRVLTDAAIKGKVDPLVGLKENVIIGKLIPAGTGMKRYSNVELEENFTTPTPVVDQVIEQNNEVSNN